MNAPRFQQPVEPYVRIDGKRDLHIDWCATIPALYWADVDVRLSVEVETEGGEFYWQVCAVESDPCRGAPAEPRLDNRWPDSIENTLFAVVKEAAEANTALASEVFDAAREAGLFVEEVA